MSSRAVILTAAGGLPACLVFLIGAGLLSGCGIFGKPPLPRRASMDLLHDPHSTDELATHIQSTDVIYFPVEYLDDRAGGDAQEVVRALRREGKPFAIGWQNLSAENQVILDQLPSAQPANPDSAERLSWDAPVRSRGAHVLRSASDLAQLALGLPRGVRIKLQTGDNLSDEERGIIPDGYLVPQGDLENFAESYAARRNLRERDVSRLYHGHLAAKQFAAEKIVNYRRQHPDNKMLVFLHRRDFIGPGGVPQFVMQKIRVRQLTLDPAGSAEQARLLTSRRRAGIGDLL